MDNQKIKSIIRFQNKFRFYKKELNTINERFHFYKTLLTSILNNYEYLNKLKVYKNINIDDELLLLSDKIKKFNVNITFKYLKDNNKTIDDMSFELYEINAYLIKLINHIAPSNLYAVFDILNININKYNDKDYNRLLFLCNNLIPVNVWCSNCNNYNEIKVFDNNRTSPTKNIIDKMIDNNNTSIVIGETSLPDFFNNLANFIISSKTISPNTENNNITFNFNLNEIKSYFTDNDNVVIGNNNSDNVVLNNKGINIYIKYDENYYAIQGILIDDILDIKKEDFLIKSLLSSIKSHVYYEILTVPKGFKTRFLNTLKLKEILINTPKEIGLNLKKKYNEYKCFQGKHLNTMISDFLLSNKQKKIDILTILFYGNETDEKLAYLLYDILKIKDNKGIADEIIYSLHYTLRNKLDNAKNLLEEDVRNVSKLVSSDIPYEKRISLMNVNESIKAKAMEKYKSMKNNIQGDNKAQSWLDGILKIPFGINRENSLLNFKDNFIKGLNNSNINSFNDVEKYLKELGDEKLSNEWNIYKDKRTKYIRNVRQKLDDAVYGHKEAKTQLERIIAQWINGESKGEVLGLCGPPGTGKTSLAKNGLSKCLVDDDGNYRPFAFLPIGGSVNGSTLVGHNYTYVGSTWGRIVDILIVNGCMNPIIFIDEVDKISNTEHGREIVSVLTHLTDLTQNDSFEDKYFSGVPLDLSRALIVFSFNDINLLDPILRDRITVIETKPYNIKEKIHILKDYVVPEILKTTGFNKDEILFDDDMLEFLITTYTNEAGVRRIKEKLVEIIRDINLKMTFDGDTYQIPYTITKEYVEDLFKHKPRMRFKQINKVPEVGLVNGLYATTSGVGGLTVIQAMKYPSEKMLDLTTTGQQGDVMKESVNYAFKIAYSLLDDIERDLILENPKFGIHIHTPEAATKKDGPSAGAAMTLAIYSLLTGKQVRNDVAMTGEIDLCKNVTAIGGVYAKLMGAKKAGVKLALIPEENMEDLIILRDEGISPEDDTFDVKPISTIYDVIKYALV